MATHGHCFSFKLKVSGLIFRQEIGGEVFYRNGILCPRRRRVCGIVDVIDILGRSSLQIHVLRPFFPFFFFSPFFFFLNSFFFFFVFFSFFFFLFPLFSSTSLSFIYFPTFPFHSFSPFSLYFFLLFFLSFDGGILGWVSAGSREGGFRDKN